MNEEFDLCRSIFIDNIIEKIKKIEESKLRFSHYTSAQSSINILDSKRFWMRNSSSMNDFMEVRHGLNLFKENEVIKRIRDVFPRNRLHCFEKITEEFFNNNFAKMLRQTFIFSLSEHTDEDDLYGKLSMWRGYSHARGVSIVLDINKLTRLEVLPIGFYPVSYVNDKQYNSKIDSIVDRININKSVIEESSYNNLEKSVQAFYISEVFCTKHPGFQEEKEWRVVYFPELWTTSSDGHSIEKIVATIGGVPQIVYQLVLENNNKIGLSGFDLYEDLLDKIIIGPYPDADLLKTALSYKFGGRIRSIDKKIVISNISIRY